MLVNGSNNLGYLTIDLAPAGVIGAGQYLVVGTAAVVTPPAALKLNLAKGNTVQNGEPDGIALVNTAKGVVLDSLSYEGSMLAVTLAGVNGPVSLVEGSPCAFADKGAGSLVRAPDGYDTMVRFHGTARRRASSWSPNAQRRYVGARRPQGHTGRVRGQYHCAPRLQQS